MPVRPRDLAPALLRHPVGPGGAEPVPRGARPCRVDVVPGFADRTRLHAPEIGEAALRPDQGNRPADAPHRARHASRFTRARGRPPFRRARLPERCAAGRSGCAQQTPPAPWAKADLLDGSGLASSTGRLCDDIGVACPHARHPKHGRSAAAIART